MATPDGMTHEEFFRIKSEAARRASQTKRDGFECQLTLQRAVSTAERRLRRTGTVSVGGTLPGNPLPVREEWLQGQVASFKKDLIRRAIGLSGEIVVKRRRGGIVFESFVGAEQINAAANLLLGEGWWQ